MRNVLITGGSKRIGRRITERLVQGGWSVAIHYNGSNEAAEEAAEEARAAGVEAVTVSADLEDESAYKGLIAEAADGLGPLTALVNNASIFQDDPDDDLAIWAKHMAVHVRAPYMLTKALAAGLAEGASGAVVNIVDQRVLNPTKHFPGYSISKMALWDQTQVLARALAPRVRVNAVGPGPVLPSTRQSDEDFQAQAAQTPLARAVEPEEIAAAVAYLLDAQAVTGQIIAVDSGQHLNWAYETDETAPRE